MSDHSKQFSQESVDKKRGLVRRDLGGIGYDFFGSPYSIGMDFAISIPENSL